MPFVCCLDDLDVYLSQPFTVSLFFLVSPLKYQDCDRGRAYRGQEDFLLEHSLAQAVPLITQDDTV